MDTTFYLLVACLLFLGTTCQQSASSPKSHQTIPSKRTVLMDKDIHRRFPRGLLDGLVGLLFPTNPKPLGDNNALEKSFTTPATTSTSTPADPILSPFTVMSDFTVSFLATDLTAATSSDLTTSSVLNTYVTADSVSTSDSVQPFLTAHAKEVSYFILSSFTSGYTITSEPITPILTADFSTKISASIVPDLTTKPGVLVLATDSSRKQNIPSILSSDSSSVESAGTVLSDFTLLTSFASDYSTTDSILRTLESGFRKSSPAVATDAGDPTFLIGLTTVESTTPAQLTLASLSSSVVVTELTTIVVIPTHSTNLLIQPTTIMSHFDNQDLTLSVVVTENTRIQNMLAGLALRSLSTDLTPQSLFTDYITIDITEHSILAYSLSSFLGTYYATAELTLQSFFTYSTSIASILSAEVSNSLPIDIALTNDLSTFVTLYDFPLSLEWPYSSTVDNTPSSSLLTSISAAFIPDLRTTLSLASLLPSFSLTSLPGLTPTILQTSLLQNFTASKLSEIKFEPISSKLLSSLTVVVAYPPTTTSTDHFTTELPPRTAEFGTYTFSANLERSSLSLLETLVLTSSLHLTQTETKMLTTTQDSSSFSDIDSSLTRSIFLPKTLERSLSALSPTITPTSPSWPVLSLLTSATSSTIPISLASSSTNISKTQNSSMSPLTSTLKEPPMVSIYNTASILSKSSTYVHPFETLKSNPDTLPSDESITNVLLTSFPVKPITRDPRTALVESTLTATTTVSFILTSSPTKSISDVQFQLTSALVMPVTGKPSTANTTDYFTLDSSPKTSKCSQEIQEVPGNIQELTYCAAVVIVPVSIRCTPAGPADVSDITSGINKNNSKFYQELLEQIYTHHVTGFREVSNLKFLDWGREIHYDIILQAFDNNTNPLNASHVVADLYRAKGELMKLPDLDQDHLNTTYKHTVDEVKDTVNTLGNNYCSAYNICSYEASHYICDRQLLKCINKCSNYSCPKGAECVFDESNNFQCRCTQNERIIFGGENCPMSADKLFQPLSKDITALIVCLSLAGALIIISLIAWLVFRRRRRKTQKSERPESVRSSITDSQNSLPTALWGNMAKSKPFIDMNSWYTGLPPQGLITQFNVHSMRSLNEDRQFQDPTRLRHDHTTA